MKALFATVAAATATLLISVPAAGAATSASGLYIRGAGFGHGIGMSQYGAGGFAAHGFSDTYILEHYYHDTTIGTVSPNTPVTVLLKVGTATFKGATTIAGSTTTLVPTKTYKVLVKGSQLEITNGNQKIGSFTPPLTVTGSGPLTLDGLGVYDGSFVFRPQKNQVQTVNQLGIDDYVEGVVASEMPSSWGMAALEAQAIAARTYVLTTDVDPGDFDAYDTTSSQVYAGVNGETPSTNAAVQSTSGQVVEYDGAPVVTYYFASSGGYTESIQNVWYGVAPEAWLVGEPDPYDDYDNNPYYRWQLSRTVSSASKTLKGLLDGNLQGIKVLEQGVSPRIVQASVVGSRGTTTVTGDELEQLFGTRSTYMSFTTLHERVARRTVAASGDTTSTSTTTTTTSSPTTAAGIGAAASAKTHWVLTGSVYPAAAGTPIVAQRQSAAGWTTLGSAVLSAGGSYTIGLPGAGVYRVHYATIYGTKVTVK